MYGGINDRPAGASIGESPGVDVPAIASPQTQATQPAPAIATDQLRFDAAAFGENVWPQSLQESFAQLASTALTPTPVNAESALLGIAQLLAPATATAQQLGTAGTLSAFAALADPKALAGLPTALTPVATDLARLAQLAHTAATPGERLALATQIGALFDAIDPQNALALLAHLQAAQTNVPLYVIPGTDPRAVPFDRPVETSDDGAPRTAQRRTLIGALERPLPDVDDEGRPYVGDRRLRLAQLALDPRCGFAPEGQAALAAEERGGDLRLERASDGVHEFVDQHGQPWQVFTPLHERNVAALLRELAERANVIVYLLRTPPPQARAIRRLVDELRAAVPTARRILTISAAV